ncbi:MAG: LmbE family protein [Actinomyces urogenitalis DORA_12]|uniref:LmbE family protein n=1 Tax=Actinomyces urogenitalis DORA_12 TaxID=1403939 RepID=W1VHW5_9ACTO|nr:MAG: LmbE family protein [Actinomyces urogenitalis DORA_12]
MDEVWFQGHKEANHLVEVQTTDLEAKVAAVRRHVSQFRDLDAMEGYLREAALAAGTQAARPGRGHQEADQPVLAESFFRWVLH